MSFHKKIAHTDGLDVRSIESSSLVAAGFGTTLSQVAGFHRAVPSTTLDKACMQFDHILLIFSHLSTPKCIIFFLFFVHNSFMDIWHKNWYDTDNLYSHLGDEGLEKSSQKL